MIFQGTLHLYEFRILMQYAKELRQLSGTPKYGRTLITTSCLPGRYLWMTIFLPLLASHRYRAYNSVGSTTLFMLTSVGIDTVITSGDNMQGTISFFASRSLSLFSSKDAMISHVVEYSHLLLLFPLKFCSNMIKRLNFF